MAFRFIQVPKHVNSSASPPSTTAFWRAIGTTSHDFVHAYALASTPAIITTNYGIQYRQDVRVQQEAYDQWRVEVPYGPRKNETGEWTWDFDTTGGTVRITHAKEEVSRYPTATAPNQYGAIGVDGDTVSGTDIVIPAMKINVSYKHPLGVITLAQAKFLSAMTGKVNSTPFLTFAPGEVLFLGARGSDGTQAEAMVGYQFAMSNNATGLSIGAIANIAKAGHDVIWVRYQDAVETADGKEQPVRTPKFVYVDRVYDTIDMATALGFGA